MLGTLKLRDAPTCSHYFIENVLVPLRRTRVVLWRWKEYFQGPGIINIGKVGPAPLTVDDHHTRVT